MFKTLFLLVGASISCTYSALAQKNAMPSMPVSEHKIGIANCSNFAGTFGFGPFYGQSNDHNEMDTVFLCLGDTLHLIHHNDGDLSGDPVPVTPPGIGLAFYTCPPVVLGPALSDIMMDSCLRQENNTLLVTASGTAPDFAINFVNTGFLQVYYNNKAPLLEYFAPITIDDFNNYGFEPAVFGGPPGPCVHVNTIAAFPIVFLNAIKTAEETIGVNGNLCQGKFRIKGGLPEFNVQSVYKINISLANDTSVHANLITPVGQLFHDTNVLFEVSEAGVYTITVEDGKSCGVTFSMSFGGCVPVGTDDIQGDLVSIAVTPNPFHERIVVTLDNAISNGLFRLFDVAGREIKSFPVGSGSQVLKYEGMDSGVYFWQLEFAGRVVKNGKLVKW